VKKKIKPQQKQLSYSKQTDAGFFIGAIAIPTFCIFVFRYWAQLGFNILFLGYWIFGEIRLATILYATIIRAILYPSALVNKYLESKLEKAAQEFESIQKIKDVFKQKAKKKQFLSSKKKILLYSWFHLCFLTMNAITIGYIFFQKFNRERLTQMLYFDFYMPKNFPIQTEAVLPIVGQVNLAVPNMTLNFYSAIGAGIVGLAQVIFNKKVGRRQLVKYLVFFPLGAYYLTCWVPSGFEFALIVFEILTFLLIIIEKITQSKLFKYVKSNT